MTAARLEVTYRRLLRCYPRRWRQEHGDEIVATLLDMADTDGRTRPSPGDVVDLVAHGLAARFGASLGLVPSVVRHRVAVLALASVAVLSSGLFVVAELLPEPFPTGEGYAPSTGLTFGPFVTVGAAVYPLPVSAFVAAWVGARRAARALSGLTCLATCAAVLVARWTDVERPQLYLLVVLCLLAAMAGGGMPTTVRRRDLLAAAALCGLLLAVAAASSVWLFHRNGYAYYGFPLTAYRGSGGLVDTVEMMVPAAVIVGVGVATVVSVRRPGWAVAAFVVGATWSLMPIAASIRYDRWGWENNYAGGGFVFVLGAAALAAVLDLAHAAGLRIVRDSHQPAGGRDISKTQ
ncbi:hypothetical protein [Frankia sp. QA3]|uniref:hypothetical protein n=1 Tax=Frankia sp. QA3 TaxID=710111 RepID=UPI000269BCCB|nr:hypothetical protein [Frankia sp. QA3]EIV92248.1 hypothetical protein FraQA3DRAFT_1779 [Frankia sp. QA3]